TGVFTPFFADEQSDLNGLHENIMGALERAVGFIAVMHPRGDVIIPGRNTPLLTRASVWVEQEIAIAAFINRGRKQKIPTAVYRHASVGREGMRDLLHLNPVSFETNEEILAHLKIRLPSWNVDESKDVQGEISLKATPTYSASGRIVALIPMFRNDGPRANDYSCTMYVPTLLVRKFGSCWVAVPTDKPGYSAYRVTETHRNREPILNDSTMDFMSIEASMTDLNSAERATLINTPVHISAQIGERIYRASIPVADIFPVGQTGS
ncbi:MAG: hypothetical protein M3O31_09700, partial [Acidobacteriota bacterium]|nr:hypothetical protein [Acidobacteriota bacterium]